jgi:N-acetylneuraminic acid mutarotase
MIVWGGATNLSPLSSGGRYDPATDSWVPTSTGAAVPAARARHSAVWTGAEMVVWGGFGEGGGNNLLNTGGRYVPATDTWSATSTGANVPAPRWAHTMAWTGAQVVVWGGYDGTPMNSGGRYDPATNTWLATSAGANVPSPRYFHTALWTGTRMIVWGGQASGTIVFDTGGRYDPATDTWLETSAGASVPEARSSHSAVWTGTRMIVWGGKGTTSSALNSGGRYDPVADAWSPTSTGTNVAVPRYEHLALWTGTRMVVWGGLFFVPLNSGGRYDPATDTWATLTPAPTANWGGPGVWSGSEMIVWGGLGDSPGNTGGRYDPSSDTWAGITTAGDVPQARTQHTMAWSGTEAIVWGGMPRSSSGGRYCACASPATHYRDLDGDGYGDAATTTTACTGSAPAGWVATGTDCDDANAQISPGAPEVCNDLDDDCDDVVDDGFAVPESPVLSLDAAGLTWAAVVPGTGYDVVRGALSALSASAGDFSAATDACQADDTPATTLADSDPVASGDGYWYLVRAVNCRTVGTWNSGGAGQQGSRDAEIAASANACP